MSRAVLSAAAISSASPTPSAATAWRSAGQPFLDIFGTIGARLLHGDGKVAIARLFQQPVDSEPTAPCRVDHHHTNRTRLRAGVQQFPQQFRDMGMGQACRKAPWIFNYEKRSGGRDDERPNAAPVVTHGDIHHPLLGHEGTGIRREMVADETLVLQARGMLSGQCLEAQLALMECPLIHRHSPMSESDG